MDTTWTLRELGWQNLWQEALEEALEEALAEALTEAPADAPADRTDPPLPMRDVGTSDAKDKPRPYPARVMSVHRGHVDIASEQGNRSLSTGVLPSDETLTVGDWILVGNDGRVIRLLPRKSLFRRRAAGGARQWQLIAANVDVLFIVSSCNQDFNIARLERYLVLAEQAGVWPVIVLTRKDLTEHVERYRHDAERLRPGIAVEAVNALDADSVATLAHWCAPGQTVALVGSSGVGKSTLINTLTGDTMIATGGIREDDAKGRHTTTARSMHRLANGGWLLDTPGMREIQLADVQQGIEQVFDDITELATHCRFSDCRHQSEPGCAVREAIAEGRLDEQRLRRYQKLEREDARNSESLAERHARERQFGRIVKEITADRRRR